MARLSKSEAARQLGISRTTLYRLIEHGRLSPTPNALTGSFGEILGGKTI